MNARDLTALVHLVGFTTGVILYAMLGVMTRRRLAYVVAPSDHRSSDRIPLVAALLGVIWNVGAMMVYAARDFGIAYPMIWLAAVAYTALGFLPAVVVHSTLRRSGRHQYRAFVGIAYAGSAAAGVLHFVSAAGGETPSRTGLLLLTVTYGALLAILAVTERRRPGFQRSFTAVALAAFAVSALHLSHHAGIADQDPWPIELIGHHASLPLVLAILYQDYRFAFADLFLKRALSLLAIVVVVSLLYAELAAPLVDPHAIAVRHASSGDSHLFTTEALLAMWIATALAYPFIQRGVYRFVDRVVLSRTDYREFRAQLARNLSLARDAEDALDVTCTLLAHALDAPAATWRESAAARVSGHPTISLDARRSEACITIPTAIEPSYEIRVAELSGGRALLSDDLMLIDAVAASVGRRIDEIRVEADRTAREQREQDILRLATEAELRALRAQLNPHFLFNALNTLGHLMQSAPDRALATLYQLTGLLRAVLRRTNGRFVALGEELEIVESYLSIEHERFQERLTVSIEVPTELRRARIPPLLLQPLVENAVKHGIAAVRQGGRVTVRAERDTAFADDGGYLRLYIVDTGPGTRAPIDVPREGLGLSNVEERLRHYFGAAGAMTIRETPGGGTTVELCLPWITVDVPVVATPV
jgi:two-component system, LytTR family, sensor kinase